MIDESDKLNINKNIGEIKVENRLQKIKPHNTIGPDTLASNASIVNKLYVLSEIEKESTLIAKEFYKLNKQLQVSLNHISAASVCCLQTFSDSIEKLCDSIDDVVKEEELLLLKAKELSKEMEPAYELHNKITSIKTIISALESQI